MTPAVSDQIDAADTMRLYDRGLFKLFSDLGRRACATSVRVASGTMFFSVYISQVLSFEGLTVNTSRIDVLFIAQCCHDAHV